jgi:hypothetical protein
MKKEMVAILALVCVLLISGCTSQNQSDKTANNTITTLANDASAVQKVEVLHFHGTHQCQSCINVGRCAEDAINEYFQSEQRFGILVFAHVNAELPENADLVQQYDPTGSSLWIGVYNKNGSFSKEQNINVWYKTSDMEKCREYIKEVIEGKLKGE